MVDYGPLYSEDPYILGQINFDEYYGFLLTHSVNKETIWVQELSKFVRKCFEIGHMRIFGICFGHQMIAKVLGFNVVNTKSVQHGGETIAISKEFQQNELYKEYFGTQDTILVMESHGEEIEMLPPSSEFKNSWIIQKL